MLTEEQKTKLDDLIAACQSKEPLKVADAFHELILDKTAALIDAERQKVAQTMFQKEEVMDNSDQVSHLAQPEVNPVPPPPPPPESDVPHFSGNDHINPYESGHITPGANYDDNASKVMAMSRMTGTNHEDTTHAMFKDHPDYGITYGSGSSAGQ